MSEQISADSRRNFLNTNCSKKKYRVKLTPSNNIIRNHDAISTYVLVILLTVGNT